MIVQPLLKKFPKKALVLLIQIFNGILCTNISNKWEHAIIVMIGDNPKSYMHIFLLSIYTKLVEWLLIPQILNTIGLILQQTQFGLECTAIGQNNKCHTEHQWN